MALFLKQIEERWQSVFLLGFFKQFIQMLYVTILFKVVGIHKPCMRFSLIISRSSNCSFWGISPDACTTPCFNIRLGQGLKIDLPRVPKYHMIKYNSRCKSKGILSAVKWIFARLKIECQCVEELWQERVVSVGALLRAGHNLLWFAI